MIVSFWGYLWLKCLIIALRWNKSCNFRSRSLPGVEKMHLAESKCNSTTTWNLQERESSVCKTEFFLLSVDGRDLVIPWHSMRGQHRITIPVQKGWPQTVKGKACLHGELSWDQKSCAQYRWAQMLFFSFFYFWFLFFLLESEPIWVIRFEALK